MLLYGKLVSSFKTVDIEIVMEMFLLFFLFCLLVFFVLFVFIEINRPV